MYVRRALQRRSPDGSGSSYKSSAELEAFRLKRSILEVLDPTPQAPKSPTQGVAETHPNLSAYGEATCVRHAELPAVAGRTLLFHPLPVPFMSCMITFCAYQKTYRLNSKSPEPRASSSASLDKTPPWSRKSLGHRPMPSENEERQEKEWKLPKIGRDVNPYTHYTPESPIKPSQGECGALRVLGWGAF